MKIKQPGSSDVAALDALRFVEAAEVLGRVGRGDGGASGGGGGDDGVVVGAIDA